jgi:hypothetical protein
LGCAVSPFYAHETARTVGKGKNEFTAGYGRSIYAFNWATGVTDRLDLGIHWESYGLGLRAKYALIPNPEKGFALALATGAGLSVGGHHLYVDLMGSEYFSKTKIALEPYGAVRVIMALNDPAEFRTTNDGKTPFLIPKTEYLYSQFIIGNRFWLSESWILSVEASKLLSITQNVSVGNAYTIGAALGYRLPTAIF